MRLIKDIDIFEKSYREIGLKIIEQTFDIILKVFLGSKKNININQ